MLVPKLRFKREDGTDYPEWKDCILSDYCEEIKASIDPKKYPNDSFLEYSMPAFDMGKIPNNVIGRDMNSNRKVVNYPCVLINKLNVRKKRIWKVLKPMSNSVCSAEFIPVKSDKMSIDFLECLALSDRFTARLLDCSTGTSNSQKRVAPNIIMDMSVSISCLEEQQKIADFLSTVDEVIIQSEAEVRNLEQQKKSAMQKIFSQELRFKREDGTEYPKWELIAFGNLYQRNNERNGNQFKTEKTISVATMKYNEKGNGADKNSLSTYKVLRLGDIAFEGHENKEFSHGRFVLNDIGDGIMSPRFSCLRPVKELVNGFWKYYIHYEPVMYSILLRSTKKGTMMHELVYDDFYKQSILVPKVEEQQKIADFLSALDEAINYAKQELDKWKELKKGLLQQMFV